MQHFNKNTYFGISIILIVNEPHVFSRVKKILDQSEIYYCKKRTYFHLLICGTEANLNSFDIFKIICLHLQRIFGDKICIIANLLSSEVNAEQYFSNQSHELAKLVLNNDKNTLHRVKKNLPSIPWGSLIVCLDIATSGYCYHLNKIFVDNGKHWFLASITANDNSLVCREDELDYMKYLLGYFLRHKDSPQPGLTLHINGVRGIGKTHIIDSFIEIIVNDYKKSSSGKNRQSIKSDSIQVIKINAKENSIFSKLSLVRKLMSCLLGLPEDFEDNDFRTALHNILIPVELHLPVLYLSSVELKDSEKDIYRELPEAYREKVETSAIKKIISLLTSGVALVLAIDDIESVEQMENKNRYRKQLNMLIDATYNQKVFLLTSSKNKNIFQVVPQLDRKIHFLELRYFDLDQTIAVGNSVALRESTLRTDKTPSIRAFSAKTAMGLPGVIVESVLCGLLNQDLSTALKNKMNLLLQQFFPNVRVAIKLAAVFGNSVNAEQVKSIQALSLKLSGEASKSGRLGIQQFPDNCGFFIKSKEVYHFYHSSVRTAIVNTLSDLETTYLNQYCAQWFKDIDFTTELVFKIRTGDLSSIILALEEASKLNNTYQFNAASTLINEILDIKPDIKHQDLIHKSLLIQAQCFVAKYCIQEAIGIYNKIIEQSKIKEMLATCYIGLVKLYRLIGSKNKVSEYLYLAEHYGEKCRKWHVLSEIFQQKGDYLISIGKLQEAEDSLKKSIVNSGKIRNKMLANKAKISVSHIAHLKNDITYATKVAQELTVDIKVNSALSLSSEVLYLQAILEIETLNFKNISKYALQALHAAMATGEVKVELDTRLLICDIFLENLSLKKVRDEILYALDLAKKVETPYYESLFLGKYAQLHYFEGNRDEAKNNILKSVKLMKINNLDWFIGGSIYTIQALVLSDESYARGALRKAERINKMMESKSHSIVFYQRAMQFFWQKKDVDMLVEYYYELSKIHDKDPSLKSEFYLQRGNLMIDILNGVATVKELTNFNSRATELGKMSSRLSVYINK